MQTQRRRSETFLRGNVNGKLIGIDKVREFVTSVILTGRVKHKEPVSAMIIAEPERGKTSVVLENSAMSAVVLTDVTGKGLQLLCAMNETVSHFIINDLLVVMAHSHRTREYFFTMLNAMLEEGVRAIASPAGITASPNKGRRGFIGCTTSNNSKDNRMWWHKRGIARRILPFHYEYSQDLVLRIKMNVDKENESAFSPLSVLKIPEAHIEVTIPETETKEIRRIADLRAAKLGQLGISLLKNYRNLARGHALLRSWKNPVKVTVEDVEFLKRIDPYVDWETPAIL